MLEDVDMLCIHFSLKIPVGLFKGRETRRMVVRKQKPVYERCKKNEYRTHNPPKKNLKDICYIK